MTKIYITGGPGSGKTTYARKLAQRLNIPCFDLDEVKWINAGPKGAYNQKRDKQERAQIINRILENKDWICEGVYFKEWVTPILEQADEIIILKPTMWVRQYRVVKRSLKRICRIERPKHKENLLSVCNLLNWSAEYDRKHFPKLMERLEQLNTSYRIIARFENKK